jgi:preprotein translocase subunit SecG
MSAVILFQKSESSLGLGTGTMGGMMTARGTANLLTRLTAILGALFFALNIWLAYLASAELRSSQVIEVPASEQKRV